MRLGLVGGTVEIAEGHGANSNGRDHGTILAKLTLLHITRSKSIGVNTDSARAISGHAVLRISRKLLEVAATNEMGRRYIAVE